MNDLLTKLYAEYHLPLLRYAIAYTRNVDDSEDLVSETFVRTIAAAKAGKLPPEEGIRGWLFFVLRNILIDLSRRRIPVPMADLPDIESPTRVVSETTHEEVTEAIRSVLGPLPDRLWSFAVELGSELVEVLDEKGIVGRLAERTGLTPAMVSRNKQRLQGAHYENLGVAPMFEALAEWVVLGKHGDETLVDAIRRGRHPENGYAIAIISHERLRSDASKELAERDKALSQQGFARLGILKSQAHILSLQAACRRAFIDKRIRALHYARWADEGADVEEARQINALGYEELAQGYARVIEFEMENIRQSLHAEQEINRINLETQQRIQALLKKTPG